MAVEWPGQSPCLSPFTEAEVEPGAPTTPNAMGTFSQGAGGASDNWNSNPGAPPATSVLSPALSRALARWVGSGHTTEQCTRCDLWEVTPDTQAHRIKIGRKPPERQLLLSLAFTHTDLR